VIGELLFELSRENLIDSRDEPTSMQEQHVLRHRYEPMLLSVAHAIDCAKNPSPGFAEPTMLSGKIEAPLETDRMAFLWVLDVDLTLNKTRLKKHLARVLQMQKGLRCSAILIEAIEGLEADLQ
jgi:hypothetical protein